MDDGKPLTPQAAWLVGVLMGGICFRTPAPTTDELSEPNTGDPFMDGAIRMSRGSSLDAEMDRLRTEGVIR